MIVNSRNDSGITGDMRAVYLRDPLGKPMIAAGWELEFEEMPGFRFFVDERPRGLFLWSVSELSSGARVCGGDSRAKVIKRAKCIFKKNGGIAISLAVQKVIEEHGVLNAESDGHHMRRCRKGAKKA